MILILSQRLSVRSADLKKPRTCQQIHAKCCTNAKAVKRSCDPRPEIVVCFVHSETHGAPQFSARDSKSRGGVMRRYTP